MAVVMLAIGSRGDVQPMAVLSAELRRRGVTSRVVALADYADLARGLGAEVVPVAGRIADALELTHSRMAQATFRSPVGQAVLLRRWLAGASPAIADAVLAAVGPGDSVLTGVLTRDVASALAQARGCRAASLIFTAQLPTVHAESHYWAQHYTRWAGYNLRAGRLNWSVASTLGSPVGSQVRRRLGLPRAGRRTAVRLADTHPVVVAASPVLVPPAPDWRDHVPRVHQTGWLAPPRDGADTFEPPTALAEFLAAGRPPAYVGFGSMAGTPGHGHLGGLVEAARRSGVRVVTPALDDELPGPVTDDVLAIGSTPHEWLLPRMSAVVHHGGAGTTHAGLRAGVPSAAAWFGVDQPYHAYRLHRLGVGPEPFRITRATPERLAGLLTAMVRGPQATAYARRAADVGARLRAEDGVGETVRLLDRWGFL